MSETQSRLDDTFKLVDKEQEVEVAMKDTYPSSQEEKVKKENEKVVTFADSAQSEMKKRYPQTEQKVVNETISQVITDSHIESVHNFNPSELQEPTEPPSQNLMDYNPSTIVDVPESQHDESNNSIVVMQMRNDAPSESDLNFSVTINN